MIALVSEAAEVHDTTHGVGGSLLAEVARAAPVALGEVCAIERVHEVVGDFDVSRGRLEGCSIVDIAEHVDGAIVAVTRVSSHHHHVMSVGDQTGDEVAADEATATGNEHLHPRGLPTGSGHETPAGGASLPLGPSGMLDRCSIWP